MQHFFRAFAGQVCGRRALRGLTGQVCGRRALRGLTGLLLAATVGCGDAQDENVGAGGAGGTDPMDGPTRLVQSELDRAPATPEEAAAAAGDNRRFALDFYRQIADPSENLVYSPYSISVAATMLSAGAEGNTLSEIETAVSIATPPEQRHQSHNALAQELAARNHEATERSNAQILRSSNDFWMLPTLSPGEAFMDTLAVSYGSGVHLADFVNEPEPSREAINAKVSDDTAGLIPELLPADSIDAATVFVLTNALYFKARWALEFGESLTAKEPFHLLDGGSAEVDMMRQTEYFEYGEGAGYRAASLPYSGNELDLVVVLPDAGTFGEFVAGLDDTKMQGILDGLTRTKLDLWMPKLEIRSEVPLKAELQEAGMVDAFVDGVARFGPIADGIFISAAFHQAAIIIDEEGTEAAAATAFVGGLTGAPPPETPVPFHLDQPFLFVLRDRPTNTPLFVGHFVMP